MKKFILAALSILAAVAAQAVPVTFQVDLAEQINNGTFVPGVSAITARGSFNEWGSDFVLTAPTEEATVYTGTREVAGAAGATFEYKFVINSGSDIWEGFSNNRSFTLSDTAQTLPVSPFNNPQPVTFQVNMATQVAANAFDPAAGDTVEVRGPFNNWGTPAGTRLEASAENPAVYTTTVTLPSNPGANVEYKFVIVRSGVDPRWESGSNRSTPLTGQPQTIDTVYFDNVTGIPTKGAILFQVDMTAQEAAGNFDKAIHQVWIRGNKTGWGDPPQGLQLFEDLSRPGVYTNTYRNDALITGETIEYKATMWKPGVTWENGDNKRVTFQGNEPADADGYRTVTIPTWYFDNVRPGELVNEETVVTFRVDMRNARTTEGVAFDPVNDSVLVNGSFLPAGWAQWGAIPLEQEAFDNGMNGDAVANDGIYSWQYTLPRGASARLAYKYSINNADNEAAAGNDHIRYVRATGTYALPLDTFGTMTQETLVEAPGDIAIRVGTEGKVVLTWQGAPGIKVQRMSDVTGGTLETINETDGLSSYEASATGTAAFFRLVRE
jgi:hypothetical protein